jgi:hypothetical protein
MQPTIPKKIKVEKPRTKNGNLGRKYNAKKSLTNT